MRRCSKVYCSGCAHLFVIKGEQPLCVATAGFIEGPLRSKIDVLGLISAEKRNLKNDCGHRKPVSIHAWEVKRWLLRRMSNGIEIKEGSLTDYPIEEESDYKQKLKESEEKRQQKVRTIKVSKNKEALSKAKETSSKARLKSPSKAKRK